MMEPETIVRILIVDDTVGWRELLATLLEYDGYDVEVASNYTAAISHLETEKFDVVVLDMRLIDDSDHNVDGMRLLSIIKGADPSVKAIILTGYPEETHKQKALDYYGADAYLEKAPDGKPFDIEYFSKFIRKII